MNKGWRSGSQTSIQTKERSFRRVPIAHAIALMLTTGGLASNAYSQQAFSAAWYAQKGAVQAAAAATGKLPNGMPAVPVSTPLIQQQQANVQLQRSLANLSAAARSIALQQAQQGADRLAASAAASNIPNGLGVGGLNAGSLVNSWINANGPTQSTANGQTIVDIKQTADKAILNWETFNIGKNTILQFDQQADWSVLNRVNNATAPSVIQGQIKAPGTVMIVNANGIIFSGSSQVNTRNLVVAATHILDSQFNTGIYSPNISTPSFTGANGNVLIESGAEIATHEPSSVTAGGGYVLVMGKDVHNAGEIVTRKGQTTLAAGDSFFIRKGVGTEGNTYSTTRGNEVAAQFNAGSDAGKVTNTGLIIAREGDITFTGRDIQQNGVAVASSTVNTRGTIHLLNSASDTLGKVTLGQDSVTAILIEDDGKTALDSQRDALIKESAAQDLLRVATGPYDNLSTLSDRRDQSRIEIVSGGDVNFAADSLTLATGGQIAVSAKDRSFVADKATLDVSGAVGVNVSMASNNVKVNVQGNELRDSPDNRDSGTLFNSDIWLDRRDLILVPAGTGGYASDRWYAAGGLLEVSGYLSNQGHSVGEWAAQGGTVTLGGSEVITQKGSVINLSGGSVNVQTGMVSQTWLKGSDGKLYRIGQAPAGVSYVGIYKGYEDKHERWGASATKYYYNPLIAARERLENGYTAGRDAGQLIISAPTAVMEGSIVANVYQGEQQTRVRDAVGDGYKQAQTAVAKGATISLGQYSAPGRTNLFDSDVKLGDVDEVTQGMSATDALDPTRINTVWLDSQTVNDQHLSGLDLGTRGNITIDKAITLNDGGTLNMIAANVDIKANVTVHGGSINASDSFVGAGPNVQPVKITKNGTSSVTLQNGVTLDVSGRWINQMLAPSTASGLPYLNGGAVKLESTRDINIAQGSVIDASSGAAILDKGKQTGGKGGSVTLVADADATAAGSGGMLTLAGDIKAFGVSGGGTLKIETGGMVVLGADPAHAAPGSLHLSTQHLQSGFSKYDINGHDGLQVLAGAQLDVLMPVYRIAANSLSNIDGAGALEVWTPTLYTENPQSGVLTQRRGASLSLTAGHAAMTQQELDTVALNVAANSVIRVDAGQSIELKSDARISVDGHLQAAGGAIRMGSAGMVFEVDNATGHDRAIRIGSSAVLDVAGVATTALDNAGRAYGKVLNGGEIRIGGKLDPANNRADTGDLFVVIEKGALLDASGTHASLNINGRATQVASSGGEIILASRNGLYLDGDIRAASGGQGAAGGTLSLALETGSYDNNRVTPRVLQARELILKQASARDSLTGGSLTYGHAVLGVNQVKDGGFDSLNLLSDGVISFDGNIDLSLGQNLRLYSGALVLAESSAVDARVNLAASYVRLANSLPFVRDFHKNAAFTVASNQPASSAAMHISAQLLDVQDVVNLESRVGTTTYRRGFQDVHLESAGDLRFLQAYVPTSVTRLNVPDQLRMTAAQMYPATDAMVQVTAQHLITARSTLEMPAIPYSVFGQLYLLADVIDHGGIVRAPLGALTLGQSNGFDSNRGSQFVNLLPGSVLSVSAKGLVMPYGGTVDGQTYSYAGRPLSETKLGVSAIVSGVSLLGQSVDVAAGAVIDLSGGGDLTGAGFVSGRGGSVDILQTALINANPGYGYSASDSQVYAIVPTHAGPAPLSPDAGAGNPMIGRQITLNESVGGLPAGTYTLMPSTYALLPGAYRIEISNSGNVGGVAGGVASTGNGSYVAAGTLGFAHTGFTDSQSRKVILTPGSTVRKHSLYNEMSYIDFALADAARLGVPRPRLAIDTHQLALELSTNYTNRGSLSFRGDLLNKAAQGGWGGVVSLNSGSNGLEVVAQGSGATTGFAGVTLIDTDLNAFAAGRLLIGGTLNSVYGQSGNFVNFRSFTKDVAIRSGATLRASDIFIVTGRNNGGITIEQGARLDTLGMGTVGQDSRDGFIYVPGSHSVLAVSNGYLNLLAPTAGERDQGPGRIDIGGCLTICSGTTQLYSEGTIVAATDKAFTLDNAVRYGTRNLTLAVGGVNIGTEASIAAANTAGILPAGLELNQTVLNRLLQGDTTTGAPALETLVLNARDAVNFFGTVELDTIDPLTGKSRLDNLVLTTGGIYGYGTASDVATIRTGNLIWNGSTSAAPAFIAGGAGTGSGALNIEAQRIEFGFGPDATVNNAVHDRLALGFANVNLNASQQVTANHKGTLRVAEAQGAYVAGKGFEYSGGNLNINTPVLTTVSGAVNRITAGGDVTIGGAGTHAAITGLGGELSIKGENLIVDSNIVLPSGKLTLAAVRDVTLTNLANIDLAGREVTFSDVKKYSWGGDLALESEKGNIQQADNSVIDLSARNNNAGTLKATALDASAGIINLLGQIKGTSSGRYDAGGTIVPYRAGAVDLRGQSLGDFAALNQRLNTGEVFGERHFQIKQGDLTIGDEVKANVIVVSLDNGHLNVLGKVDASGERVGTIRLSAADGLTVGAAAQLDAHGSLLRVDSYGKIIESPNRAIVELNSGSGTLTLESGSRIDLRHGTSAQVGSGAGQSDGIARGTLNLNALQLGANDIAIDASGAIDIQGARSIAVNAVRVYSGNEIPLGSETTASGRPYQTIDQAWLNDRNTESNTFINAALGNSALMDGKLAGLNNATYRDSFHLRPLVDVKTDGDLVINGDLNLSEHRYAGVNPHFVYNSSIAGSGEVGSLVLRAGGDLTVYGSITDGFLPPPDAMPEETGWVLLPGKQPFNTDVIVPRAGIELQDGTAFPSGRTLNYDLPIQGMNMAAGTRLPVAGTVDVAVTLPADTILSAAIRNADNSIAYAAGTRLSIATTISKGMIFDAGTLLTVATRMETMTWPKGIPLPHQPVLAINDNNPDVVRQVGMVVLPMGGYIPAGTDVQLGAGVEQINLRSGDGKGKSWALAQMLPEGSQSWSMRLVAGADTAAADARLTNPYATHGRLMLVDTHYGMKGAAADGVGLNEAGALDVLGDIAYANKSLAELNTMLLAQYGQDFATYTGMTLEEYCGYGDFCKSMGALTLNDAGALDLFGDVAYGNKSLAELNTILLADHGQDFATYMGMTLEEYCGYGDFCSAGNSGTYEYKVGNSALSVIRTGTGDLELISAKDMSVQSLYGIYTAGSSSMSLAATTAAGFNQPRGMFGDTVLGGAGAGFDKYVDGGADSLYRAWYPDHGGNLHVSVGGNLTGDLVGRKPTNAGVGSMQFASSDVGNWLWRQSGAMNAAAPTAWWINFGTYAADITVGSAVGFTGFGTLGGGNVDVRVAGDAGMMSARGDVFEDRASRSQGIVVAVGSTGRVIDGALVSTGGGDMDVRIGGGLNPEYVIGVGGGRHDLQGSFVNLRGALELNAGSIGRIDTVTGGNNTVQDRKETRAYDPFTSTMASAKGGLVLMPGDSTVHLSTRGDMVVVAALDGGRVQQRNSAAYSYNGTAAAGGGYSWFSMWTDRTALNLFSAGGNLTPITALSELSFTGDARPNVDINPSDGRYVYPSILRAVAANGNLYYGTSGLGNVGNSTYSLMLAPGKNGALEFLAGNSIYAGGYAVSPSGANVSTISTPFNSAWTAYVDYVGQLGNGIYGSVKPSGENANFPLFAFAPNTVTGISTGSSSVDPARFYARDGDIVGLRTGEILNFVTTGVTLYEGARPVWIKAGRDIVNSGTQLGQPSNLPSSMLNATSSQGNLFVHNAETDVSLVQAGRDLIYSSFNVAGPGTLEISAGRNLLMEEKSSVTSLGSIVPGDSRAGASIAMTAGANGLDFHAVRQRYLDPANLADAGLALSAQPGKAVKTYEVELTAWLQQRFGFSGSTADALTYFDALPGEQQRIFLRNVYYTELREGGREYNNPASSRYSSYLRGREMIATLLPTTDGNGHAIERNGDIVMFGGAGVRTNFGGDVQMMAPGGQMVFGVQGQVPPASAGIVTQGQGDINLYSQGSVLLGLSRIMTTFGGDILAWSAQGDINAGRGSKTTVLYTPPKLVYDDVGNVTLSPQVPSSGAGLATLNPIPEAAAGDMDLIAPLGTIDAGEAGIRVSGNVNLAALQIVNAANIQVQGKATGIPMIAAVNVGALTNASAAASSAAAAAQDVLQRDRSEARKNMPSIFTVRVLGFGNDPLPSDENTEPAATPNRTPVQSSYDPNNRVQLIGHGQKFNPELAALLTDEERDLLLKNR